MAGVKRQGGGGGRRSPKRRPGRLLAALVLLLVPTPARAADEGAAARAPESTELRIRVEVPLLAIDPLAGEGCALLEDFARDDPAMSRCALGHGAGSGAGASAGEPPPVAGEFHEAMLQEARGNLATPQAGLCGTCPAKAAIQPWPWEAIFNPICAVDEMILTEPEGGLATPIQNLIYGGIATLVPALGLRLGQDTSRSRFELSWPWSLPLGPAFATSREEGPCQERIFEMRPLRLLLEPGLAFTTPVTFFVRPGAQAIFQKAGWNVGIGGGLGTTLETTGPYGLRASLSPELLLNWGRCCGPGYLRLALRYDLYFSGRERHAFTTHVGFSFY